MHSHGVGNLLWYHSGSSVMSWQWSGLTFSRCNKKNSKSREMTISTIIYMTISQHIHRALLTRAIPHEMVSSWWHPELHIPSWTQNYFACRQKPISITKNWFLLALVFLIWNDFQEFWTVVHFLACNNILEHKGLNKHRTINDLFLKTSV